jgi:hypothetical protein
MRMAVDHGDPPFNSRHVFSAFSARQGMNYVDPYFGHKSREFSTRFQHGNGLCDVAQHLLAF